MASFDEEIVAATIEALKGQTDAGQDVTHAISVPLARGSVPRIVVFSPSKIGQRISLSRAPLLQLSYKLQIDSAFVAGSDADVVASMGAYERQILTALSCDPTWLRRFECIETVEVDRKLEAEGAKRFGIVSIVFTLRTKETWMLTVSGGRGNPAAFERSIVTVQTAPDAPTLVIVDTLVQLAMATWDKYTASGAPILVMVDSAIPNGTPIDVVEGESGTLDGAPVAKGVAAVSGSFKFLGFVIGRHPTEPGIAVVLTSGFFPLSGYSVGDRLYVGATAGTLTNVDNGTDDVAGMVSASLAFVKTLACVLYR